MRPSVMSSRRSSSFHAICSSRWSENRTAGSPLSKDSPTISQHPWPPPVLVSLPDGIWVGLGSDHTDRKAETVGIALSKQLCAKVVGRALWRLEEIADRWDRLMLRSFATIAGKRVLYQEGSLAAMRTPADLLARWQDGALEPGTLMFCGTLGAIGGIRPASRFEMELEDPVRGRSMRHGYEVRALPVVS